MNDALPNTTTLPSTGTQPLAAPVKLVYSEWFPIIFDAIAAERRLKGWSKAKKTALIRGDLDSVKVLARRHGLHPSRRPQERAYQDED